MVSEADIRATLANVIDPELHADIVDLGMVGDVVVSGGSVRIGLALTIASCPMRGQIESDIERRVAALPGVATVDIHTTVMSQEPFTWATRVRSLICTSAMLGRFA